MRPESAHESDAIPFLIQPLHYTNMTVETFPDRNGSSINGSLHQSLNHWINKYIAKSTIPYVKKVFTKCIAMLFSIVKGSLGYNNSDIIKWLNTLDTVYQ